MVKILNVFYGEFVHMEFETLKRVDSCKAIGNSVSCSLLYHRIDTELLLLI